MHRQVQFTNNIGDPAAATRAWQGVEQHLLGNHNNDCCSARNCSKPGYDQQFTARSDDDKHIVHQFCGLYASDALCTKYQLGKNTNMVESAHEITAVLFSKYRYSATGVDWTPQRTAVG